MMEKETEEAVVDHIVAFGDTGKKRLVLVCREIKDSVKKQTSLSSCKETERRERQLKGVLGEKRKGRE